MVDVSCAFCGAIASQPFWADDEEEYSYNPDIVNHEDVQWMDDTRLITENSQSREVFKVFISGPASAGDYGYFTYNEETDPDGTAKSVIVYETAFPAIPFHSACYELLKMVISPEFFNLEILYETLKSLIPHSQEFVTHLDIDYGPVAELQDGCWLVRRGTEEYVLHPVLIPWLDQYYAKLPQRDRDQAPIACLNPREANSSDPFTLLPLEIVRHVMLDLDLPSLYRFRIAFRKAAQTSLDNSFWKHRLFGDMPWLFDFPVDHKDRSPESVDWAKSYKDLYWASDPASKSKVHALANRRRVWGLCEHISRLYHARKSNQNHSASEVLDGVQSTRSVLLVSPEPSDTTASNICFIESYTDMLRSVRTMSIHWTKEGELAQLEVTGAIPTEPSLYRDDIPIPCGDWIRGFIITSVEAERDNTKTEIKRSICGLQILFANRDPTMLRKIEGDQRLLSVSPEHFLVGLRVHTSKGGIVAKLALLEQPQSKMHDEALKRTVGSHSLAHNEERGGYLWIGGLPPSSLRITEFFAGSWSYDLREDIAPLEALVFGECEDDLSDITYLGADVHFGGFEIHYATRTVRAIGPRRHAMQYLSVDGRGGERITHVFWSLEHIPSGCRFVTNRGRQLVIGFPSSREKRYPSLAPGDKDCTLAGIAGYWPDRMFPKSTLMGFANLYSPDQVTAMVHPPEDFCDSNGFHWTPKRPPTGIVEAGIIMGQREIYNAYRPQHSKYPSKSTVVSWLDCSRPLEAVRVTFCHANREHQLPIAAIQFIPTNQQTEGASEATSIGAQWFLPPSDSAGTNGHYWCWCSLGYRFMDELDSRPHYTHETWQVGNQLVHYLNVWMADNGALIGVQFVARDGKESPRWGRCDGISSAMIHFTSTDSLDGNAGESRIPAVGIKFYLDDNERQVTRNDAIVMAVQALVVDSST